MEQFIRTKTIYALIVCFIIVGCSYGQRTQEEFDAMLKNLYTGSVPLISVEEVKNKGLDHYVVLDIREKKEYEVSHIEGAKYAGYLRFQKKEVKDLPKETPILVYCSVGKRSEDIGDRLTKMGFTNVHNLYGGIFQWKNEGNTVVNDQKVSTDSVHTYNKRWSQWLSNGIKIY